MAFWGCSFTYNDISSLDYDLIICDVDGNEQGTGRFASAVSIIDETSPQKVRPFFYGTRFDDRLEITLVCVLTNERIDVQNFLTRQELDAIATWLTGYNEYKWLTIDQTDMADVRYKCIVTDLSILEFGNMPYGIQAVFTCDGPYAYMINPYTVSKTISGTLEFTINNSSSLNGYFAPVLEYKPTSGGNFVIINNSDGDRTFTITSIPASISTVTIDCERCLIENDQDINLYETCNFKFPRLKRGSNSIKVAGNGTLEVICDFPVNPGV